MDMASLSCEKTCDNPQVHGTAIVEERKGEDRKEKCLNKYQIKIFKKNESYKAKDS